MKTTHQMARELLALPDVPLEIEGRPCKEGHELCASVSEYDSRSAIIYQRRRVGTRFGYSGCCPVCGQWRGVTVKDEEDEELFTGCEDAQCRGRVKMRRDALLDL